MSENDAVLIERCAEALHEYGFEVGLEDQSWDRMTEAGRDCYRIPVRKVLAARQAYIDHVVNTNWPTSPAPMSEGNGG